MSGLYKALEAEAPYFITFTLVDAGDNEVRVFCSGVIVTNPGSGFENVAYIVGGKFYARAQSELEKLKLKMEK